MDNATFKNPLSLYQIFMQGLLMTIRPAVLASILKKALGVQRIVIETPNGRFEIDPVSNFGLALSRHGQYEKNMISTMNELLPPNGNFIDLGANEGYFTVIAAKLVGPNGRVVSIEPQERLLPIIARNLELNGIHGVRMLNVAIADQIGESNLYLAPDVNSGSSALNPGFAKYWVPVQAVKTLRLIDVLNNEVNGPVDLIKVDIEGFEYEALLGSSDIFKEHRIRALALELHPKQMAARNKDATELTSMLSESGYRLSNIGGNTVWLAP